MNERAPTRVHAKELVAVDWVDLAAVSVPGLAGVSGGLGMAPAPGQGGDTREAVRRLAADDGVDALLLLLDDDELRALGIDDLPAAASAAGIDLLRYPIPDFGVPADLPALRAVLDDASGRVRAGERVVVACRGGYGRTGTVTACLLRQAGAGPDEAIAAVRAARPGTIEVDAQAAFVAGWDVAGWDVAAGDVAARDVAGRHGEPDAR